ncbi:MAG: hypothetical protein LIO46_01075 [Clostridiales bacterium]|nr:hypothetical protein [Clostridiales bacterium]
MVKKAVLLAVSLAVLIAGGAVQALAAPPEGALEEAGDVNELADILEFDMEDRTYYDQDAGEANIQVYGFVVPAAREAAPETDGDDDTLVGPASVVGGGDSPNTGEGDWYLYLMLTATLSALVVLLCIVYGQDNRKPEGLPAH